MNLEKSGGLVFADQMISKQPGLVPRIDERYTHQQIYCVTVHLDCVTEFSYSHLQYSIDVESILGAKAAFEIEATTIGVGIKHNHTDNGIFVEKDYCDEVKLCNQKKNICSLGAYHQSGAI
mmetsp:Transcript_17585/g.24792  ORF Transcript_17585/g.24792 Transcript_17585/m.24792 type:complete len:121 (+) Transcript_17585:907-1269(+)